MYKYTVEGLEQAELAGESDGSMRAASEGHNSAQAAPDPTMYHYSLKGIVVHSGTAFAGHYYSFIQVRPHSVSFTMYRQGLRGFCLSSNPVDAGHYYPSIEMTAPSTPSLIP